MKALRLLLTLTLCWLACASESRAYMVENRVWEKSGDQPGTTGENELQAADGQWENCPAYGERASGQEVWTKFDPEGLFAGTDLDAAEWFEAVGSGAAQGLYDNTAGAAAQSYHSGVDHMAGAIEAGQQGHYGMAALGAVAVAGDAASAVLSVTAEGEEKKAVTEGVEGLANKATQEAEQVVAKTVEQKTEATVSSSAKADAQKAATATDKATDKTYQTYTKTNPETGEVYTGRTSGTGTPKENVAARDANHHMDDKGFGAAELDKSSSNPDAIRGREQQLIEANGGAKSQGGTSGNAINGVSPSNPKAGQYKDAANKEFGGN